MGTEHRVIVHEVKDCEQRRPVHVEQVHEET